MLYKKSEVVLNSQSPSADCLMSVFLWHCCCFLAGWKHSSPSARLLFLPLVRPLGSWIPPRSISWNTFTPLLHPTFVGFFCHISYEWQQWSFANFYIITRSKNPVILFWINSVFIGILRVILLSIKQWVSRKFQHMLRQFIIKHFLKGGISEICF